MARALTKMKLDGTLYVRPAAIERQIDEVLSLGVAELRQRLMAGDKNAGGYLHNETLVHLIRLSILENRPEVSGAVLPVLLVRCEKNRVLLTKSFAIQIYINRSSPLCAWRYRESKLRRSCTAWRSAVTRFA